MKSQFGDLHWWPFKTTNSAESIYTKGLFRFEFFWLKEKKICGIGAWELNRAKKFGAATVHALS